MSEELTELENENGPSLVMFNTVTGFREAMSFIGFSCESDDVKVHVETFENEEEGLVYMKLTTEKGVSVLIDSTLKSKCLDGDAYVNLRDLYVFCDKGVKDGLVAMWVADGRLYVGSSFNESFQGFESEASLPLLEPFDATEEEFLLQDSIKIEQTVMASIIDSVYTFDCMEIIRKDGTLSFRTGNDRVTIATLPASTKMESFIEEGRLGDFEVSVPLCIFKLIPLVETSSACTMEFDWTHGTIRSQGKLYGFTYKFNPANLRTGTSDSMKSYMKFDTLGMAATIDMIYGLNYRDPTAPVTLTPLDEKTVEIKYANGDRYEGVITMTGVKMMDTEKSIELPMDISTMMVRNAGTSVLELLYGEDGRLFMTYCNEKMGYARKCMYFGD